MSGSPSGPSVVVVGGGHGASAALQAARRYAGSLTGVISVADDGGSTGRLRELMGVVALGDLRKCLVALADPGSTLARAFEHRFDGGGELSGHALGNLLLAGLLSASGDDLLAALDEAGRLLGSCGRVLPSSTERIVLKAVADRGEVAGQVAVSEAGRIREVSVVPGDASTPPAAIEALLQADQVVIGPGSLYTSVLAALVVPGIRQALREAPGQRVYVCNLRPQLPETEGYDVAAHLAALGHHGVAVDLVLCDRSCGMPLGEASSQVIERRLAGSAGIGHDPGRLASALEDLLG